jgi:hypothetical protein
MNQKTARELRKTFAYNKPKKHCGYEEKFSGQRVQELYTIDGDMVKVRQEPVNMTTLYCKDQDRRFYKAIKKLFKKSATKSSAEIKVMLTELYKSEAIL